MHLSAAWIAPLTVAAAGGAALTWAAHSVRREVESLTRALRPLRVRSDRPRRQR